MSHVYSYSYRASFDQLRADLSFPTAYFQNRLLRECLRAKSSLNTEFDVVAALFLNQMFAPFLCPTVACILHAIIPMLKPPHATIFHVSTI
jgi:hypothetical protein